MMIVLFAATLAMADPAVVYQFSSNLPVGTASVPFGWTIRNNNGFINNLAGAVFTKFLATNLPAGCALDHVNISTTTGSLSVGVETFFAGPTGCDGVIEYGIVTSLSQPLDSFGTFNLGNAGTMVLIPFSNYKQSKLNRDENGSRNFVLEAM